MRNLKPEDAASLTKVAKLRVIHSWMVEKQRILTKAGIKPNLLEYLDFEDIWEWGDGESLRRAAEGSIDALNGVIYGDSQICPHCMYFLMSLCSLCSYGKRHGRCGCATKLNTYLEILYGNRIESISECLRVCSR